MVEISFDFSFGADGSADGSGIKLDGGKFHLLGRWKSNDGRVIVNNNDGLDPNLQWLVYNNGKVILGKIM